MKKNKRKARTLGKCSKPETMGKHYKGRSKKRLSNKQKKALAKGRNVLNYLRTGRRVSEPKEPIFIKEGFLMSSKKRTLSAKQKAALARGRAKAAKRRFHGFEGFEGAKKKRPRVTHHVTMRGDPGPDVAGLGIDLAGLLAGAIGLSLVAGLVPIKNPKGKAIIPIAAGLGGLMFPAVSGTRFGSRAALGALTIGLISLTKNVLPKVPLMGGADTAEAIGQAIENLPDEEKAILGILPEQLTDQTTQGADQDYSTDTMGETELVEGVPGEMLGNMPGEMLGSIPGEMLGETETIGAGDDSDFE